VAQSIYRHLEELPQTPHVVTIGSFDGVHRGHLHLIQSVKDYSEEHGIPSLAVTFDPLPAEVLRPDLAPPRLCSTDDRTRALLDAEIDRVVLLTFDMEMANQSADDFLRQLVEAANPRVIVVGEDFAFGHKRQGTPDFLRERAVDCGFALQVVTRINPDPDVQWSSSFVRSVLTDHGNVAEAERVLNRPFRLSGVVQSGDHRGRDLGYPTANLHPPPGLVIPADGIYAAMVRIPDTGSDSLLPSLVYVGTRPTFDQTNRVIEVFLLDFNADLYGRFIEVAFVGRVRGDRKFESADQLVQQMQRDEDEGRQILALRIGDSILTHSEEKRSL
jgi:riboflavin kinase / FMN adenylyltransferase